MKKQNTTLLCMTALFMALVCIATLFFKVPIPLGYAHLGNGFILFGAFIMGNPAAILIGGVGSAMADLLGGFPEWILPTLVIKSCMSYVIAAISDRNKLYGVRTAVASVVGIVVMVMGYFIAGSIIYGSVITGAAQIPGLVSEGVVGIILFYVMSTAVYKTGVLKMLTVGR
jgi:uncharacterized membrane protein